jgi:uncharacterized membrane protein
MNISITLIIMIIVGYIIGRNIYWLKNPNLNRHYSDWRFEAFWLGILYAVIFALAWCIVHYNGIPWLWDHFTFTT